MMDLKNFDKAMNLIEALDEWRVSLKAINSGLESIDIEAIYDSGYVVGLPASIDAGILEPILRDHITSNLAKVESELRELGVDPTPMPDDKEATPETGGGEAAAAE